MPGTFVSAIRFGTLNIRCHSNYIKKMSLSSSIDKGLMVLVGISVEDTPECAEWMAKKLLSGNFFL